MLTISSWHKYLWLSTCAVQEWRRFSWSQIGFSNHFNSRRLHLPPGTTESCDKITMKHKMSPADHQDGGEGWIRSGPTKFPCHRIACRGPALQKTAWLRLCSIANQRESPQTANTQVQDLPASAAIPKEGNTGHGNDPHAGEELQECRTTSCSWTEVSSSLWGGSTSPVSCHRTAETQTPPPSSLLQQTQPAAHTHSLHLHTQCRGSSLPALTSPFWGCF